MRFCSHVPDVIAVFDASSALRYVCPLLERVTGYKLEELAGRSPLELLHPDDVERVVNMFTEVRANDPGTNLSVEVRVRQTDGSWCYLEVTGNGFFDDSIVTVLREGRAWCRAAFEDSVFGMALVSLEG